MHAWNYWVDIIADRLSAVLDVKVAPEEIVVPPDTAMGDFAFGCFKLAKERRMSPAQLAQEIAAKVQDLEMADVAKVAAVGPYVNFTLSTGDAVHRVVRDLEVSKDAYDESKDGKGKTIVFEHAQPNTHKEIHVGHLRLLLLGVSLIRLLRKTGWQVIPVTYHGDVGAHVAKCLWHMVRSLKGSIELSLEDVDRILSSLKKDQRTGAYLGSMYSASTRALDEHPEWKDEASEVQRKLESYDPAWDKLWRETRRWSLDEMAKTFDELEVPAERQYLESEVVDRGQSMVDDLLAKGVAKESQGAKVVDLEDVGLGVFLVRKSDGTSLYATKDIALAELKLKEYPKADRNIVLVDSRQGFYFKQLFETLKRMGMGEAFEHVGYEFVTLKDGAMSSREGNIVTYREFIETVVNHARAELLKRHEDWNEGKITDAAWKIAMSGIKFAFLKQDNEKVFTFDLDQALSFEGATGPYCQYAATRLSSILKKANRVVAPKEELSRAYSHLSEKKLALKLARLPELVRLAAKDLRPAVIAQWCLETAQAINDFYRDVPILDGEAELLEARLRLVSASRACLEQGLNLLGIYLPEEM